MSVLASHSERFAAALFQAAAPSSGNFVISPHSVAIALGLIGLGACGETLECILNALSFETAADMRNALKQETEVFCAAQGAGVRFESDNSLWIRKGLRLLRDYRSDAKRTFKANVSEITMGESGRQTINSHVSKVTHGLIPELLQNPPDEGSRLVATNALWLKAEWSFPFDANYTRNAVFHALDGNIKVPFMHQTGDFLRVHRGDIDSLRLPYGDGKLVFEIIVPRGTLLLVDLESSSTLEKILVANQEDFQNAELELLALAIPKFSLSYQSGLETALRRLGAGRIFSEWADFSNIAGVDEPIMVSKIIHQARLDLDEDGTEAAAATAIECLAGCPPTEKKIPKPFHADRPFLFAVRHRETGAVLFIGRIENPSV